jgi:hypothetical protein
LRTGRGVILNAAATAGITEGEAQKIAEVIAASGYACVPKKPTWLMLRNARWDALAEDAKGVWDCMIEASEDPIATAESLKEAGMYYPPSDIR